MPTIREAVARAWGFITGRRALDADLRAELEFHTHMLESELRQKGMTPVEARREARLRLGGATQISESYADQRSIPAAESFLQDVRYALRTWHRVPGFTLA